MSKAAAMDVAEKVIDVTIDAAQEAVEVGETLERIPHLALNGTTHKQQVIILAAVALSSGGVGAVVSHFLTKKVVMAKAEQEIEEQVAAAEKHYTVMAAEPLDVNPDDEVEVSERQVAAAEVERLVQQYNGQSVVGEPAERETVNVFMTPSAIAGWDQVQEESMRKEDEPYVINVDEYNEGFADFAQVELTYYVGDNTLAEDDETPIAEYQVNGMVGESNLLKFGHGSGDDNIVYVRNERMEVDYAITRAEESYAHVVAGLLHGGNEDEEIVPGVRKFRRLDG